MTSDDFNFKLVKIFAFNRPGAYQGVTIFPTHHPS